MAALLNAAETRLRAPQECPVLHFVSPHRGEGADVIALETAFAGTRMGKRVLFIDTNTAVSPVISQFRDEAEGCLTSYLRGANDSICPFLRLKGTSFFFAALAGRDYQGGGVLDLQSARSMVEGLRRMFDLVVIYSESALSSPAAVSLFSLADANLVVAEAERTRAPVIQKLHRLIETHGGHAAGAILNKRKLHIPRLIYSALFGS